MAENEKNEVTEEEVVTKEEVKDEPEATDTPVEEAVAEEVAEEVNKEDLVEAKEEPKEEEKVSHGPKSKKQKKAEAKAKQDEAVVEEALETEEEPVEEEKLSKKDEVEAKIRKQIQKKQEKQENLGIYRIGQYLKEEHAWENWLFLFISIVTLVLGCLMLTGALVVKEDFPVVGDYPKVFAWVLVGISSLGLLYALYPFFKPAFPEFKKITWLTMPKFLANSLRTFIFIIILTLLFVLYNSFITEILQYIIK